MTEQFKPNATVAAIIHHQGKFLIVEEIDSGKVVYNQPAGHIEANENIITALKREVKEETTLDIASPVQIYQQGRIKFYKTRQYSGTIKLSEEHTEYKWVTIEELDSYTIGAKFVKAAYAAFKTDDDSETGNNL